MENYKETLKNFHKSLDELGNLVNRVASYANDVNPNYEAEKITMKAMNIELTKVKVLKDDIDDLLGRIEKWQNSKKETGRSWWS